MFDDEFIENLPEDTWTALKVIQAQFENWDKKIDTPMRVNNFNKYLEACAFLTSFLENINSKREVPKLSRTNGKEAQILQIQGMFSSVIDKYFQEFEDKLFHDARTKFSAKLGASFVYEFAADDLKKIQKNINDLRELITDSEIIEDNHKQRLLKRLERLQNELHKKMSDLDRFWGFVGDAGVVMGKFGNDVKPLTDRIREMMGLVWKTQAHAEKLESGSTNLFLKDNNDD